MQNDFSIQIISTYGHSQGSLSIIVDHEIAIVGDAMLGTIHDSIFPPFADDIPKMIHSWNKLLNTTCTLFLPGLGRAIKRELLEKEYLTYSKKYSLL